MKKTWLDSSLSVSKNDACKIHNFMFIQAFLKAQQDFIWMLIKRYMNVKTIYH